MSETRRAVEVVERIGTLYTDGLRAHLTGSADGTLERAYEIGRRALHEGLGVLEMVTIHHGALEAIAPQAAAPSAKAAEVFFVESLTPFEMTHRTFREANETLRKMGEKLEDEARRIAHALHDESGWLLASVHMALGDLGRELSLDKAARIAGIKDLLDQIETQLRQISHELRPTMLDDLGLLPALDFLAKGVAKRSGLAVAVEGTVEGRLPAALETTLYRSVQEAFNNIVKHAHARHASVLVRRDDAGVVCEVRDDGDGFDALQPGGRNGDRGLGLIGMRERLGAVRGTLQIVSAPGRGTQVIMTVPLERPS